MILHNKCILHSHTASGLGIKNSKINRFAWKESVVGCRVTTRIQNENAEWVKIFKLLITGRAQMLNRLHEWSKRCVDAVCSSRKRLSSSSSFNISIYAHTHNRSTESAPLGVSMCERMRVCLGAQCTHICLNCYYYLIKMRKVSVRSAQESRFTGFSRNA